MISDGCDPILKSMRSEVVSAHVSQKDAGLSARTRTEIPDQISQGVSAKPMSQRSVREQCDQVTEGRFEPHMINQGLNTDSKMLEEFFKKSMHDADVNTAPVIFGEPKPRMESIMVQTEVFVDESNLPEEPEPATTAYEPSTGTSKNLETGSNGSLLDEPVPVDTIPIPECDYVDDWYQSELYKYTLEMHFERLVKKKLIRVEKIKKPKAPRECQGMK